MTWTLSSADKMQACGRHMNTVTSLFRAAPRDAYLDDLERENTMLRQRIRALTEAVTSLSEYIEKKDGA